MEQTPLKEIFGENLPPSALDSNASKKEKENPNWANSKDPMLLVESLSKLSITDDKENSNTSLGTLDIADKHGNVENGVPTVGKMDCEIKLATIPDEILDLENLPIIPTESDNKHKDNMSPVQSNVTIGDSFILSSSPEQDTLNASEAMASNMNITVIELNSEIPKNNVPISPKPNKKEEEGLTCLFPSILDITPAKQEDYSNSRKANSPDTIKTAADIVSLEGLPLGSPTPVVENEASAIYNPNVYTLPGFSSLKSTKEEITPEKLEDYSNSRKANSPDAKTAADNVSLQGVLLGSPTSIEADEASAIYNPNVSTLPGFNSLKSTREEITPEKQEDYSNSRKANSPDTIKTAADIVSLEGLPLGSPTSIEENEASVIYNPNVSTLPGFNSLKSTQEEITPQKLEDYSNSRKANSPDAKTAADNVSLQGVLLGSPTPIEADEASAIYNPNVSTLPGFNSLKSTQEEITPEKLEDYSNSRKANRPDTIKTAADIVSLEGLPLGSPTPIEENEASAIYNPNVYTLPGFNSLKSTREEITPEKQEDYSNSRKANSPDAKTAADNVSLQSVLLGSPTPIKENEASAINPNVYTLPGFNSLKSTREEITPEKQEDYSNSRKANSPDAKTAAVNVSLQGVLLGSPTSIEADEASAIYNPNVYTLPGFSSPKSTQEEIPLPCPTPNKTGSEYNLSIQKQPIKGIHQDHEMEVCKDILNVDDTIVISPTPKDTSDSSSNAKTQVGFVSGREYTLEDIKEDDILEAIVAMENQELTLPSCVKTRKSLLSNFDPFYLSTPVKEKSFEETVDKKVLSLFGNNPHDVIVEIDTEINDKSLDKPISSPQSVVCDVTISESLDPVEDKTLKKFSDADIANITISAEDLVTEIIECAFNTVENTEYRDRRIFISARTMADVSDKLALQEEENAELKLQLNASQQVRATLELQLRQKEEVIIKSQAEASRKDQAFKQEVKQLKEKLEEKCLENDNSQSKDLQEMIKTLKARESKILSELNVRKNDEQNYRKIMDEYEKTIGTQLAELQKLNEEHETVKRHLANLELAFSDVHQKYERSKKIIDGYKCNEDALRQTLVSSEDTVIKSEEKYESLKAHAKAQIEKSNQEMQIMHDRYDAEIHKLSAIIRRLEIKNASLADSLDQKTKECSALAALCDEVTGKV